MKHTGFLLSVSFYPSARPKVVVMPAVRERRRRIDSQPVTHSLASRAQSVRSSEAAARPVAAGWYLVAHRSAVTKHLHPLR
jgi:hypothetical protein